MASTAAHSSPGIDRGHPRVIWLPVILGLIVMYAPVYRDLAFTSWAHAKQIHGPIVLAVAFYLAWRARSGFSPTGPVRTFPVAGTLLFVAGLLSYVIGRSQHIPMFDVGSQIPVFLGILLLTLGWQGIRTLWFPVLFLAFLVPLPGFIEAGATVPLKQHVSSMAETILYAMDYPIARNGVVLTIGAYQLLIANACSGLHSIISLGAMGFLYLYLMGHPTLLRNLVVGLCILPMAIVTNVVRVIILALVTYYWGIEAGQGFLHGFAGIILFATAILGLILIDGVLGRFLPDKPLNVPQLL